ncbi:hypothetical protein GOV13_01620 [Candidatus Pacearchaeota archaeon]|nr:hypothetical protein [Candidatus Pacearchaeota archaeon]
MNLRDKDPGPEKGNCILVAENPLSWHGGLLLTLFNGWRDLNRRRRLKTGEIVISPDNSSKKDHYYSSLTRVIFPIGVGGNPIPLISEWDDITENNWNKYNCNPADFYLGYEEISGALAKLPGFERYSGLFK